MHLYGNDVAMHETEHEQRGTLKPTQPPNPATWSFGMYNLKESRHKKLKPGTRNFGLQTVWNRQEWMKKGMKCKISDENLPSLGNISVQLAKL